MKKKWIAIVVSVALIAVSALLFAACDGNEKNGAKKIVLTEDMTAEQILELLSQIENVTWKETSVIKIDDDIISSSGLSAWNKNGAIAENLDTHETIVYYFDEDGITRIDITHNDDGFYNVHRETFEINSEEYVFGKTMFDEIIGVISECLQGDTVEYKGAIFNISEWKVVDGELKISLHAEVDGIVLTAEIVFFDFNSTEIDFEPYLSLESTEADD